MADGNDAFCLWPIEALMLYQWAIAGTVCTSLLTGIQRYPLHLRTASREMDPARNRSYHPGVSNWWGTRWFDSCLLPFIDITATEMSEEFRKSMLSRLPAMPPTRAPWAEPVEGDEEEELDEGLNGLGDLDARFVHVAGAWCNSSGSECRRLERNRRTTDRSSRACIS